MTVKIDLQNVSVEFPIYNSSNRSIKNKLINMATGGRIASSAGNKVLIKSLNGINLNLKKGDRVGLYGHNGAGKSTLLRVMSGAYSPSGGEVDIEGRVVSLLDINVGMDGEFTGFENIMLRGVLLGYSPSQIAPRVNEIAEFSELGEYLNMPIRTYSSGMNLRLAFSIVTSFDADIILMDEWLSVGDESFKKKAADRLKNMVDRSSILVIADHDIDKIYDTCNKVIFLEHGEIKSIQEVTPELRAARKKEKADKIQKALQETKQEQKELLAATE
ncbi:ABC transporter ATP-binding protein [Brackiella oedipodis]|uniref:ABC transporter ATP-binding protein n=1 Tax=Brackiella oedipodis TaxID=124225 RepID=UPI0009FC5A01|nr:ABC transporter ATP-binding protein [Brackiella oedipodis]